MKILPVLLCLIFAATYAQQPNAATAPRKVSAVSVTPTDIVTSLQAAIPRRKPNRGTPPYATVSTQQPVKRKKSGTGLILHFR